jgi:hypothetical protein
MRMVWLAGAAWLVLSLPVSVLVGHFFWMARRNEQARLRIERRLGLEPAQKPLLAQLLFLNWKRLRKITQKWRQADLPEQAAFAANDHDPDFNRSVAKAERINLQSR